MFIRGRPGAWSVAAEVENQRPRKRGNDISFDLRRCAAAAAAVAVALTSSGLWWMLERDEKKLFNAYSASPVPLNQQWAARGH